MMNPATWGALSAGIALCMAAYGYKRKSLCTSGALAATLVGFISFYVGARFGVLLIAFFLTSSRITKVGAARKKLIEEDFKEGGMRDWGQVLANSAPGLLACSSYFYYFGLDAFELSGRSAAIATFLQMAYLGHYACCAGDTWASELGVLAQGQPILVTTFRKVPTGTNGAVSIVGLLASVAGGACMGFVFCLFFTQYRFAIILIGAFAGFIGSMIDSFLGACFQYSGFCSRLQKVVAAPSVTTRHITGWALLSNSQVNFLSALLTAFLTGASAVYWL